MFPWMQVIKIQQALKQARVKFSHEQKRAEHAMNRMKQRLALLQTTKKDKSMSMEVLNCVGRPDGRRSSWRTGDLQHRRESAMLSSLLSKQEVRQQSLHTQNLKLRQLLTLLNHEIHAAMTTAELPAVREAETSQLVIVELEDIEKLESDTKQQWQLLKSHIKELGIKGMTSEPEVVECLKSELRECQKLLYLHEKVLKQFTSPPDLETKALLQDSYLLEERESFLAEQQRFAQERTAFKMERKRFTDSAICLGHERRLFEVERASWMQQQLSSLTPFCDLQPPSDLRPNDEHLSNPRSHRSSISPSSPSDGLSPAFIPHGRSTPSTKGSCHTRSLVSLAHGSVFSSLSQSTVEKKPPMDPQKRTNQQDSSTKRSCDRPRHHPVLRLLFEWPFLFGQVTKLYDYEKVRKSAPH
uniref:Uncharacterized protein n=1 Tax=Eptatretus burgeri TaxID=7764 RepID=A0A8C4WSB6_EPTBU